MMPINQISDSLIADLRSARYNESTIHNYKCTLGLFRTFAEEKGCRFYIPEIGAAFAKATAHPRTGEFSLQRHKMRGRCVRLMDSYYHTGTFDLSMKTGSPPALDNPSLRQAYDSYLQELKMRRLCANTVHFYGFEAHKFLQFLRNAGQTDVSAINLATPIRFLQEQETSRQRAVLCGLRSFFRFLQRQDLLDGLAGIHSIRVKKIIPVLNDEEEEKLWNTLDSEQLSFRDKSIILLSLMAGMRACDIVSLRIPDIDWNCETVSFIQQKTGNQVFLPLLPALGNAISKYIVSERPRTETDHLFVRRLAPYHPLSGHSSCYCIIKNAFRLAGIDLGGRICGTRLLRHSAASGMVRREVPLGIVSAVLGHADPESTDVYITTDDRKLRECVLPMVPVSGGVLA